MTLLAYKYENSQFEVVNTKRNKIEFRNNLANCAEYIGCNVKEAKGMLNGNYKHRTYILRLREKGKHGN